MRISPSAAWPLVVAVAVASASGAELRYEGSSGVLPNDAQWQWGYQVLNKNLLVPQVTAVASGGVTTLDSTAQASDLAGYTTHVPNLLNTSFTYVRTIPLDRNPGFEADFTVKLASEQHTSNDRAGFSVVALSSDATPLGIELAFWQNEIWAQNANFTHGESSGVYDTTAALVDYRLSISGTTYTLAANNAQILTGNLRDYSEFASGIPTHPHSLRSTKFYFLRR
jgi:hypothetical protein